MLQNEISRADNLEARLNTEVDRALSLENEAKEKDKLTGLNTYIFLSSLTPGGFNHTHEVCPYLHCPLELTALVPFQAPATVLRSLP